MDIIEKSIIELKVYENNPRFNDDAVDAVAKSIQEFGFLVPILIDCNDVIIAGDTRRKAAITLNMEKVPCIYVENLTEEQVRAFRLVENKTSEYAKWDFEKLAEELAEIIDVSMDGFDFPQFDFDDIGVTDADFLQDVEVAKDKTSQKIKCPSCGAEFQP